MLDAQAFPHYFRPEDSEAVAEELDGRWRNLFRFTDHVGWSVFHDPATLGDDPDQLQGKDAKEQSLPDPRPGGTVSGHGARPRDLGRVTVAATRGDGKTPDGQTAAEPGWDAADARTPVDGLLMVDSSLGDDICEELRTGKGTAKKWKIGESLGTVDGRLDELRSGPASTDGQDIRLCLLEEIRRVAVRLADLARTQRVATSVCASERTDGAAIDPARLLHETLWSIDLEKEGSTVLAALEVVCFAELIGGSPGSPIPSYAFLPPRPRRSPRASWSS